MTHQQGIALFVGPDGPTKGLVESALSQRGFECLYSPTVRAGLRQLRQAAPQWVILEDGLPRGCAREFLKHIGDDAPRPAVVVVGEHTSAEEAFELARLGADAFVSTPKKVSAIASALDRAADHVASFHPAVLNAVGRLPLTEVETRVRETMVREALTRTCGNRTAAARLLQVSRQHMQHMLRASRDRFDPRASA